ncbi:MAG: AAA family ATPase, partial [Terricaulis silvestris]
MFVKALQVVNYKSFADSGRVELSQGFNAIIGPNNSGKTSFLEGLRTRSNGNVPHRDLQLRKEASPPPESRFILTVQLLPEELFDQLMSSGGSIWIPHPQDTASQSQEITEELFKATGATVTMPYRHGGHDNPLYPSHQLFRHNTRTNQVGFTIAPTQDRQGLRVSDVTGAGNDSLHDIVDPVVQRKIFVFRAERLGNGRAPITASPNLLPDASNLPRALFEMQSSPDLWKEFNAAVNQVLPSIRCVAISNPSGGSDVEIRLWPVDPSTRRDDLIVPLEKSGTGVGQVLALLCAAMTNYKAVIGIDEPNNFLHPGAVKALVGILKRFEHQYIITSHSLDALAVANPRHVYTVSWSDCVSQIARANLGDVAEHRRTLADLGIALADVFGMETV